MTIQEMNRLGWQDSLNTPVVRNDGALPTARTEVLHYPTTTFERLLLLVIIVLIPLEDTIPAVGGFSLLFMAFALVAAYIVIHRSRALARVWLHPVLLAGYVLIFVGFLSEFFHPFSNYRSLMSLGLMFVGAIFIAALCRDRAALRFGMYAYIIASAWLSVLLFMSSYGALNRATAANFKEASRLRSKVAKDIPVGGDLNTMAFLAVQGGTVALALTLTSRSPLRRTVYAGSALLCLVAAFLPMSRGGAVIAAVSTAAVLSAYRIKRVQAAAIGVMLGVGVLMIVPSAVFSRMQGMTSEMQGRKEIYDAAWNSIPKVALLGIGAGNYWEEWALNNGFSVRGSVLGAHNTYFQIIIFWGLPALISLLAMIWLTYRCFPKRCDLDPLALCLPGIGISLFLVTFFTHTFYDKWYAVGFGLLVGTRLWIWPDGIVPPMRQE